MAIQIITNIDLGEGLEIKQNKANVKVDGKTVAINSDNQLTSKIIIEGETPFPRPFEFQIDGKTQTMDKMGRIKGTNWYVFGATPMAPAKVEVESTKIRDLFEYGRYGSEGTPIYLKPIPQILEAFEPIISANAHDPSFDNGVITLATRWEDGYEEILFTYDTRTNSQAYHNYVQPYDESDGYDGIYGPRMNFTGLGGAIVGHKPFLYYGNPMNDDDIPFYVGTANGEIYTYEPLDEV